MDLLTYDVRPSGTCFCCVRRGTLFHTQGHRTIIRVPTLDKQAGSGIAPYVTTLLLAIITQQSLLTNSNYSINKYQST